MPIAEFDVSISQTDFTPRMNFRPNLSSTSPFKTNPKPNNQSARHSRNHCNKFYLTLILSSWTKNKNFLPCNFLLNLNFKSKSDWRIRSYSVVWISIEQVLPEIFEIFFLGTWERGTLMEYLWAATFFSPNCLACFTCTNNLIVRIRPWE